MHPVSCLLFRNILDNARIASSTETVMIGQSGHACLTSHCHVSRCDGASFSHWPNKGALARQGGGEDRRQGQALLALAVCARELFLGVKFLGIGHWATCASHNHIALPKLCMALTFKPHFAQAMSPWWSQMSEFFSVAVYVATKVIFKDVDVCIVCLPPQSVCSLLGACGAHSAVPLCPLCGSSVLTPACVWAPCAPRTWHVIKTESKGN